MHPYGVRDVERLLRLPRATIRAFIAAGFVSPARGPRNAWLFSFQDLIVLRTAQALADAKVPQRRITRSVRELRRHLPDTMPLSGLNIGAVGERVVVSEGGASWQAESGQYLLAFEGDPADGSLSVIDQRPSSPHSPRGEGEFSPFPEGRPPSPSPLGEGRGEGHEGEDWFEKGVALERGNTDAALRAYEKAITTDPARLDAHINLGRLLHEAGRFAKAERAYRDAIKACGSDPVLLFNLGVLLEDMNRKPEAVATYEAALRGDPGLADGHYNLALLCEQLGKPRDAIRHMSQYRRLAGSRSK